MSRTAQEMLEQLRAQQAPQAQSAPQSAQEMLASLRAADAPKPARTWGDVAKGVGENALSLGTSMVASPVAEGVATALEAPKPVALLAKTLLPPWLTGTVGTAMGALRNSGYSGDQAAEDVMRAGTYQPRTEAGQDYQQTISSVMAPVGQAVEFVARGGDVKDPLGNEPSEFGEHAIKLGLGVLGAKGFARPVAATGRAAGNAARAIGRVLPERQTGRAVVPYTPPASGPPPRPRAAPTPEESPTPTLEQLREQADAAYKQADASGAGTFVTPAELQNVLRKIERDLLETGARPKNNPATFNALDELRADAMRTDVDVHSIKGLEGLRRVISNARGAAQNGSDAASAGKMLEVFDDWFDQQGSQYAPARQLFTRYSKGMEIQRLIERAQETASSKYSQSGLQNALMQEFRALVRNDRKMRKFTPAERKMLKNVINGNMGAKALRQVSKLAPVGYLPMMGTIGSLATGGFMGGPMGLLAAAGIPIAGGIGRLLSTRQTMARANAAGETMRRGALPPPRPPYPYPLVQTPQREQP